MRNRVIIKALFAVVLTSIALNPARAGCLNPPVPAQSIGQFKANPKAVVAPASASTQSTSASATAADMVSAA